MAARSLAVTAIVLAIASAACQRPVQEAGLLPEEYADLRRLCNRPVLTRYTVEPSIKDRERAVNIIARTYERILRRDPEMSGRVSVWMCIDTNGRVRNALVNESSGNEALDAAALDIARELEFTPARDNDEVVPVWIRFPIMFGGPPVKP